MPVSIRHGTTEVRQGDSRFQGVAGRGQECYNERYRRHPELDLSGPHPLDGVGRRVSASVGAVTFLAASEHAADILALADMTMYDAKEAGRNQVALLSEGDVRGPRTAARLPSFCRSRVPSGIRTPEPRSPRKARLKSSTVSMRAAFLVASSTTMYWMLPLSGS